MSGFRLPAGGHIDRDQPVTFSMDGRSVTGFEGDTAASALIGAGQTVLGRSFKYHRPRGLVTLGSHEPSALLEIHRGELIEPNCPASMVPLRQGLQLRSQNRFPSLRFDLMSVNGLFSSLLSAGFYYKTFKWPAAFWEPVYEALIRRAAGLGRASTIIDETATAHRHTHCDVLVIGGGVAGIHAALAAARSGASVVICDEHPQWGGALRWHDGREVAQLAETLATDGRIRCLASTTAVAQYDDGHYVLIEQARHASGWREGDIAERLWNVHARRVVLATGAFERPLLFANNDLPGVMSAEAISGLVEAYGVSPGRRIGFCTNNDSVYPIAEKLDDLGIFVSGILDLRETESAAQQSVQARNIPVTRGVRPVSAHGWQNVSGMSYTTAEDDHEARLECDCLGYSAGFDPTIHLACHLGGKPEWRDDRSAWLMSGDQLGDMILAGAARGLCDTDACATDGTFAGSLAAQQTGHAVSAESLSAAKPDLPVCESHFPMEWPAKAGKTFVDLQHDVTSADIRQAISEGYDHTEQTKRYTTLGMATDQGKGSMANGLAVHALATGQTLGESRPITFRPPFAPVSIGALAGYNQHAPKPEMRSPLDACHTELGARFEETGGWKRPIGYPRTNETLAEAAIREILAVRNNVGICDVSTLGKIDLYGPDALAFFDRLCCSRIQPLSVGQCRYFIMLREDGHVLDDGTVTRISDEHLFVTTTTAHGEHILAHMEFHAQSVWPETRVIIRDATAQWAAIAVAGPSAKMLLADILPDSKDVFNDLRFMRSATLSHSECEIRLLRVSFSGECGFELYVHPDFAESLWQGLLEAGTGHQLAPYGLEALNCLRMEKGFLTGAEINGQTTAWQLRLPSVDKPDHIGKQLATRPGMVDEDRPMLVGLKPRYDQSVGPIRVGAQLYIEGFPLEGESHGYVTSAAYSPTFGHWIGLGLLWRGSRITEHPVTVHDPLAGSQFAFDTVLPCQYDPSGERLRG